MLSLRRIIFVVLIIAAGIFIANRFAQSKKPPKQVQVNHETQVKVIIAKNAPVHQPVKVTGKLVAENRIEVFAEVSGILLKTKPEFREGNTFSQGATLLKIDDEEARLNLLAQKSEFLNILVQMIPDIKEDFPESFPAWDQYIKDFDLNTKAKELPELNSEKEKYYISSRKVFNLFYSIQSQEFRLSKYRIQAPFKGVVTQSFIKPGTLVRAGQKVGEYISTKEYELEASILQDDVKLIKNGASVRLVENESQHEWAGKVKRISQQLDPATQTIKVYISVSDDQLSEGKYLTGFIDSKPIENGFKVGRNMLIDGDKLYVVKNEQLDFQVVKVERLVDEMAIVSGLQNGVAVLDEPIPGAYKGMHVKIAE